MFGCCWVWVVLCWFIDWGGECICIGVFGCIDIGWCSCGMGWCFGWRGCWSMCCGGEGCIGDCGYVVGLGLGEIWGGLFWGIWGFCWGFWFNCVVMENFGLGCLLW